MYITYRDFRRVTFPVYRLPSDNWYSEDGLLFVDGDIVDDKNMSGKSLGIRRAQTYFEKLLPLKKSIETPVALIKQTGGPYIDMAGKCFIYEKTKFCQLKYYKIKEVEQKISCSILRVHEIKFAFTIPRPPQPGFSWAGILHIDNTPWLLYEYAESRLPTIRRKV